MDLIRKWKMVDIVMLLVVWFTIFSLYMAYSLTIENNSFGSSIWNSFVETIGGFPFIGIFKGVVSFTEAYSNNSSRFIAELFKLSLIAFTVLLIQGFINHRDIKRMALKFIVTIIISILATFMVNAVYGRYHEAFEYIAYIVIFILVIEAIVSVIVHFYRRGENGAWALIKELGGTVFFMLPLRAFITSLLIAGIAVFIVEGFGDLEEAAVALAISALSSVGIIIIICIFVQMFVRRHQ